MRHIIMISFVSLLTVCGCAAPVQTFTNPIGRGADPFMVRQGGWYYYCESVDDLAISIRKTDKISDRGERKVVWTSPDEGWNKAEIWAPELHYVQGRWYIYYAGSDGNNVNHKMGVLRAVTDDPQGAYEDMGHLYTGDHFDTKKDNRWAIDATVLEHNDKLYCIWSGWKDHRDIQYLYIATMENPWTLSSSRVQLCDNADYVWERVGDNPNERGLNEGPQILRGNDKIFIVYSCSSSWDPTYKLNYLWMDADTDPMDPASWTKKDSPAFKGAGNVYGTGHACFTKSPDGKEDWIIFHTKVETAPNWNRVIMAQPFSWDKKGFPVFGDPVQKQQAIPVPSGQK